MRVRLASLVSGWLLEIPTTYSGAMAFSVTASAEGEQIGLGVVSQTTPWPYVVHLEVNARTAPLTSPTVALQDSRSQLSEGLLFLADPRAFEEKLSHAPSLISARN